MVGLRWGSHNCSGFGRETQKFIPTVGAQREGSAMSVFLVNQMVSYALHSVFLPAIDRCLIHF